MYQFFLKKYDGNSWCWQLKKAAAQNHHASFEV